MLVDTRHGRGSCRLGGGARLDGISRSTANEDKIQLLLHGLEVEVVFFKVGSIGVVVTEAAPGDTVKI